MTANATNAQSELSGISANRRQGYSFKLVNIDCLPGSAHFNVVMQLDESIAELLPYLAAVIPNCTYVHGSGVVNVMDAGHIVGIYPERITLTDVSGPDQAAHLCALYFSRIQAVREHTDSIQPLFETRPKRSVLDFYRELPKTNCGQCGHATCLAFAAALYRGESALSACLPLASCPQPAAAGNRPASA